MTEGASNSTWVFLNAAFPYKVQKLHTHNICGQPVNMIVYPSLMQAAPLVCMEARKRARLSQKELERIAGQLINVDMDIIRHGIIILEETERGAWRESPCGAI